MAGNQRAGSVPVCTVVAEVTRFARSERVQGTIGVLLAFASTTATTHHAVETAHIVSKSVLEYARIAPILCMNSDVMRCVVGRVRGKKGADRTPAG
jgi:hypothetical protein